MSIFGSQQQPMYGNPYQQRYPQQLPGYYPQQMTQQQTGLIQVNGMEGAKAYPMGRNDEVALFDAGRDVFYVKRTDAGGYPSIEAYTFAPMQDAPQQPAPEYVTRQEFEELKEVLMSGKQPVRRTAKQPSPVADEE